MRNAEYVTMIDPFTQVSEDVMPSYVKSPTD